MWCFGDYPDRHAFRGSYGGYAFPLHDRRPNINAPNISPALVAILGAAYGQPVAAEDIFDAILCLLSATSYTLRFAEDLEDVFPHVPFPARHENFQNAVLLGREIRAVEIFAREPNEAYRRPAFVSVTTQPRGTVAAVENADGAITLCSDGTGRITGWPESVWNFSISGYRLVPRWLDARVGLPADLAFVRELRDICGRIAELIDLFARALCGEISGCRRNLRSTSQWSEPGRARQRKAGTTRRGLQRSISRPLWRGFWPLAKGTSQN